MITQERQFVVSPFETIHYIVAPEKKSHLEFALRKRREFYFALGLNPDNEPIRDNEPAFHRAFFLENQNNPQWVTERIHADLQAVVRERLQTYFDPIYYRISNGKLTPEDSPQSIASMIKDGVEARGNNPDHNRELTELKVWEEVIDKTLANPNVPIGIRFILLSPPSPRSETYGLRYVNEIEIVERNKERMVRLKPNLVNLDEQGYKKFATELNPNILDGMGTDEWDTWLIGHPILTDIPVPTEIIREIPKSDTDLILRLSADYINKYQKDVSAKEDRWIPLANDQTALYNKIDELKKLWAKGKLHPRVHLYQNNFELEFQRLTALPVTQISSGCGLSDGFRKRSILENSVVKFGVSEDENYEDGKCESCNSRGKIGRCSHKCYSCEDREHPDVNFTRN